MNFDNAYYSAPFRLVCQSLRVRGGAQTVRIYTSDYRLVATHTRANKPGERKTHEDHLPPDKIAGLMLSRESCQAAASDIGPATEEVVKTLLDDPAIDRIYTVGRLLKLRERFGDQRLEAACKRALRYDHPAYKTIKKILSNGLEKEEAPLSW